MSADFRQVTQVLVHEACIHCDAFPRLVGGRPKKERSSKTRSIIRVKPPRPDILDRLVHVRRNLGQSRYPIVGGAARGARPGGARG